MAAENNNTVEGLLEITEKGHGFLRETQHNYPVKPRDPFVSRELIAKYYLREGLLVKGHAESKRGQNPNVKELVSLCGREPDEYVEVDEFDDFVVIDPNEMIRLETGPEPLGTRVMDLLTPIGKGQRGLIVAPPRTGKTILLQQ